ncbi:single-stranded-DNA-specific exonuclease RecJ [Simiduia curdlanivorans]|uniref:Single-stranded-DNA-specific exonuclease RecJ n=1 Tax=Simiduia curdlanivorans TaxID=1492769 RepID=A0ABV8V7K3_9GAMM|nr:single-stranded-DNA-specific exonuclease RecJ [Simiduia curdlanivorans]MDN3639781.1 single-stranded-DNA-specific exonuclease RecJ [Simiduia curdlanivorans]
MDIRQRAVNFDSLRFSSSMPKVLQRIYGARGAVSEDDLPTQLAQLMPPAMLGIDAAVAVLAEAIATQQRILIVGDFDADGATSSALAVLALQSMGAHWVDFLVPNRFDFGYGLTPEIVEVAKSFAPDVIVTVDNGISSIAGAKAVKDAGIKLVITDHHLPADETPVADAIVNPNQHGCEFLSKNLAGVGVIFYVMSKLRTTLKARNWFTAQGIAEPNMAQFLDLVALGTVADVVPLDANNRLLVRQGLARIKAGACRPGITALLQVAGRNPAGIQSSDMGFAVGPRLNAAGRLDDMTLGIQCLLSQNADQAMAIAQQLDDFNRDRRSIESAMQKEAEAALSALHMTDDQPWGISLFHEQWHQGVIGILASRIKERFHRPVILFALAGDGEIKGSGRSIQGLHLRDALDRVAVLNPGLIIKFGGHAMAAGLSLKLEDFARFQSAFDSVCRSMLSESDLQAVMFTDGELDSQDYSLAFAETLINAGPWGQHFPEPSFDGDFILREQRIVGAKHLKMTLSPVQNPAQSFDAIAFGVDLALWPNAAAQRIRAVFKLDINEFRGQRNLQLMVNYLTAVS